MNEEIKDVLSKIEIVAKKHPEYKLESYHFIMGALHYTVSKLKKPRHVSGQELSWGIRDYAIEQFGPLAKTVFEYWGISSTHDFGQIVYYLIECNLMTKTEEDSLDDFKEVYTFDEAFVQEIEYDI